MLYQYLGNNWYGDSCEILDIRIAVFDEMAVCVNSVR